MIEQSFPIAQRTLLRLAMLGLMALIFGTPVSRSAVTRDQRLPLATDEILDRISKAHITGSVSNDVFNSFRLSGCMKIQQSFVPTTKTNLNTNCLKEETGVLQPSLAYVSIVIGASRVTDLIDMEQQKGWQIMDASSGTAGPLRSVSVLQKLKYDALVENTRHSLPALLAILRSSDQVSRKRLELTSNANGFVIKWRTEYSVNQFFFDNKTFLCEKQTRTVGSDSTVINYSNYKLVSNVMLPHTIVMAKGDGTIVATRDIQKWDLAVRWPTDHFRPDKIGALDE